MLPIRRPPASPVAYPCITGLHHQLRALVHDPRPQGDARQVQVQVAAAGADGRVGVTPGRGGCGGAGEWAGMGSKRARGGGGTAVGGGRWAWAVLAAVCFCYLTETGVKNAFLIRWAVFGASLGCTSGRVHVGYMGGGLTGDSGGHGRHSKATAGTLKPLPPCTSPPCPLIV